MKRVLSISFILIVLFTGSVAQSQQSHETSKPDKLDLQKRDLGVSVYDQDGRTLNFYSDLIKDKTVAINFIFTTCTTICPPLAATFAKVQRDMGERVGRDVFLISVSVDPETDTPERLKAWGAKFKAGPGWTFVTGGKTEIDRILAAFSQSVKRKEDHSPTVMIGNESAGWTRAYGLAKASELVRVIDEASKKHSTEKRGLASDSPPLAPNRGGEKTPN